MNTKNLKSYTLVERQKIRKLYSRINTSTCCEFEMSMKDVVESVISELKSGEAPKFSHKGIASMYDWKFSPIEFQCWCEIKNTPICRDFCPEFPIDKYFVDFADPVHKIVIECDGYQYHKDVQKDIIRQNKIKNLGWKVFRFSSSQILSNLYERIIIEKENKYEDQGDYQNAIEAYKHLCIGCFFRSKEFTGLFYE